jgi:hypothetical protein
MSSARAFFEDLKTRPDPFAYLSSLPGRILTASPFFEEEWLDFKGKPRNEEDEKRIWSKALSGYANITDGLIVWGIDARKQETGHGKIDAACGLSLISNPAAFESKLRDWIRDATNPPVMGVEFESYAGPDDKGFVVCLVPESNHKPHRAEFAGRHYYYRASDDFLMAEPGLLRTLFYPKNQPRLGAASIVGFGDFRHSRPHFDKLTFSFYVSLILLNEGNYTANNVCVVVEHDYPEHPESSPAADWKFIGSYQPEAYIPGYGQHSLHSIAFASERPIPPGFKSMVGNLRWRAQEKRLPGKPSTTIPPVLLDKGLVITLGLYGDGVVPLKSRVDFGPDELRMAADPKAKRFVPIEPEPQSAPPAMETETPT